MAGEPVFAPSINPAFDIDDARKPRLRRTDFGDGFSQIGRDGMNHDPAEVTLTWKNVTCAEGAPIFSFFETRGGDQAFLYQVPFFDDQLKWTAPAYRRVFHDPDAMTITVSLKQDFRP